MCWEQARIVGRSEPRSRTECSVACHCMLDWKDRKVMGSMTRSNWLRTCRERWSALAVMIVALASAGGFVTRFLMESIPLSSFSPKGMTPRICKRRKHCWQSEPKETIVIQEHHCLLHLSGSRAMSPLPRPLRTVRAACETQRVKQAPPPRIRRLQLRAYRRGTWPLGPSPKSVC